MSFKSEKLQKAAVLSGGLFLCEIKAATVVNKFGLWINLIKLSPKIKFGKKSEKLKNLYVAIDHPGDSNSSIVLNHLISNIKPSMKEENENEISKF